MFQMYISAFQDGLGSLTNYANTAKMLEDLALNCNAAPIGCIGCFGESQEISFQLTFEGCVSDILQKGSGLQLLPQKYEQESVLLVDKDGDAFLYWVKTNQLEHFGKFVQTDAETAKAKGYYTKCGEAYFVTSVIPRKRGLLG